MSYCEYAETVRTLIHFAPVRELFVSHVERWRKKMKVIAVHVNKIDQAVAPLSQFEWPVKFTTWVLHSAGCRCWVPAEIEEKDQRLRNRLHSHLFPLSSDDQIRELTTLEQFTALAAIHDRFSESNDPRLGPSELCEYPIGEAHYAATVWTIDQKPDQTKLLHKALVTVLARIEEAILPATVNKDGELLVDIIVRIRNQWGLQSSKSLAAQTHILIAATPTTDTFIAANVEVEEIPQTVTLDQMAAVVSRHKKTLERRKSDGTLPQPDVHGGGGKPDEWYWSKVKPILEGYYDRKLPARFPSRRK